MARARGKKGVGRLRQIIESWDPQTAWTRRGFRILRLTRWMIEAEPGRSMQKVKEHRELCLAEGRRPDPGWVNASVRKRRGSATGH